jgi:hypothetical protein
MASKPTKRAVIGSGALLLGGAALLFFAAPAARAANNLEYVLADARFRAKDLSLRQIRGLITFRLYNTEPQSLTISAITGKIYSSRGSQKVFLGIINVAEPKTIPGRNWTSLNVPIIFEGGPLVGEIIYTVGDVITSVASGARNVKIPTVLVEGTVYAGPFRFPYTQKLSLTSA